LDLSGHLGLTFDTIALLELARREVAEITVKSFLVEPGHPRAGDDLEGVEFLPVTTVVFEDGGVTVQLGLDVNAFHNLGLHNGKMCIERSDGGQRFHQGQRCLFDNDAWTLADSFQTSPQP
jgi:hypothetical protein